MESGKWKLFSHYILRLLFGEFTDIINSNVKNQMQCLDTIERIMRSNQDIIPSHQNMIKIECFNISSIEKVLRQDLTFFLNNIFFFEYIRPKPLQNTFF